MVSNAILIGITVGVFFAGIGVSYAIFSSTFDPNTMKFANQELFDQMMSNNPKMTAQWIESTMQENQDFMQDMMQNNQMMDMMKNMMGSSGMVSSSTMSGMQFSVDAPITMPLIDGYYNGEKVYFIHTEVSDKDISEMLTMMVNFPTLYVSELKNISPDDLSIVYIFTNGIPGSGPYGGGPFFFQIDIFDAVPGQKGYSQFRSPHLVTWNENSSPRLLTSVEELLEAEANGEVTIEKTDLVVNAPMMVWKSNGMEQRASMVQRMFEIMPGVDGEITNIDVDNYIVMLKLHSKNNIGMMDQGMMNP